MADEKKDILELRCPKCQSFMEFVNYSNGEFCYAFLYECKRCCVRATIIFNDIDGDKVGLSHLREVKKHGNV